MVNINRSFGPKWIGILLLQIALGLVCIFYPWYRVILFSISFALITFLFVKFRWWAYIFVFFIPLMGVKNPGFIIEALKRRGSGGGFGRETFPLIVLLSIFPLFAFMLCKWAKLHKDTMRSPFFIPGFLFLYYSFFTFFWSPAEIDLNFFYSIYLICDISLFYFMFHVVDNQDFHRRLMWCLIFSGVALSIQVFLTFFSIGFSDINFRISDRLIFVLYYKLAKDQHAGWFAGPAVTAITLDIIIFVALGLMLTEKSKARIWFLRAVIAMLFVAVFSVGNRGGIYSLVTTIFVFIFISGKLRKNALRNSLVVIFMIFLIFLGTSVIGKHGTPRAVNVTTAQGSSLALRFKYWNEGFKQLGMRSLTFPGLGIGGYTAVNNIPVLHPHNLYLHFFFDFGLIGIIFIGGVILILAKILFKIINSQETYLQNMSIAFGIILICIGIDGLVSIPYYLSTLWFFLPLALATFRLTQKELTQEKDLE